MEVRVDTNQKNLGRVVKKNSESEEEESEEEEPKKKKKAIKKESSTRTTTKTNTAARACAGGRSTRGRGNELTDIQVHNSSTDPRKMFCFLITFKS